MNFSVFDESTNSKELIEFNFMKYEIDKGIEDKSISLLKNIESIEKDIDNQIIFNSNSLDNSEALSKFHFSFISSDLRLLIPIYILCP